eukprot:gnl/MRDRNA2_/MRDRNA2_20354_c0_seq1.p1 gnl/MRDRNA2_/MRDRNA2_20354_c0~~gnl/MRDRNA2_/MRDRNA2_20354_c0_seq1.p1  ORF type:complete len:579 (-),score=86.33 gnl/MRDRNA2_/MRDRNA2_20354_c0_seq1:17-1753(-)
MLMWNHFVNTMMAISLVAASPELWRLLEVHDGEPLEDVVTSPDHAAHRMLLAMTEKSDVEIQTVYTVRADSPGKIWRHSAASPRALHEASRRLTGTVTGWGKGFQDIPIAFSSERERVLSMISLNNALYPEYFFTGQPGSSKGMPEWYSSVYAAGEHVTASANSTSGKQEMDILLADRNAPHSKTSALGGTFNDNFMGNRDDNKNTQVGVAAGVVRLGNVTVLLFRGTYSKAGESNIMFLYRNWMLEKMGGQIKRMWNDAGFGPVTEEQNARKGDDFVPRCALRQAAQYVTWEHGDALKEAVELDAAAEARLDEEGFWPVTQAIVRDLLPEDRQKDPSPTVLLSGHSQGGFRASAVSMWLSKVDGKKYKTYSLAGTGTQCATRKFSMLQTSEKGLLDYLDPFVHHPQIITYQHPFDMYSHMDFQNGVVCSYGNSLLEKNSLLYKTFEKLVGYSGPQMFSLPGAKVANEAMVSRYWTHSLPYMLYVMKDPAILFDDGTTDGGCAQATILPKDSSECASGEDTLCDAVTAAAVVAAGGLALGIIILIVALIAGCCCGVGCCAKYRMNRSKDKIRPDTYEK